MSTEIILKLVLPIVLVFPKDMAEAVRYKLNAGFTTNRKLVVGRAVAVDKEKAKWMNDHADVYGK